MVKFEVVSKYADAGLSLPKRKTAYSAGYDFEVAEDICIPTWTSQLMALAKATPQPKEPYDLKEMAALTKQTKAKPIVNSNSKLKILNLHFVSMWHFDGAPK